jgi:hypothetical protein
LHTGIVVVLVVVVADVVVDDVHTSHIFGHITLT